MCANRACASAKMNLVEEPYTLVCQRQGCPGMSVADIEALDAVRFQRFIRQNQFPRDCSATEGQLTRAGVKTETGPWQEHWPGDYFYGLGLGSQMTSLKFNFVHALLRGRVYHFPTSHYVNPVRCARQTFDCYFEPTTNCSRLARPITTEPGEGRFYHSNLKAVALLWCFELPRERLTRLAGLRAVHAEAWYHGQLAAFLFRPNSEMRAFRDEALRSFAFDANDTRAETLSAAPGGLHNGSCAAMHIRRTDKFKGRRREDRRAQKGFGDFGRSFKGWAHFLSPNPATQARVLLGSEDPATFREMPSLVLPAVSYWLPDRYFVMNTAAGMNFKNINDNNERLVSRYDQLVQAMAQAQRNGTAAVAELEARGVRKDEGMTLVLQILMMSECDALFGSYASNVAILVHDLMHSRMVARRDRLHAFDINGRTYCGCGASFCMKLEKRSIKDPTRTFGDMVQAFKGRNINAI
jgi:hypothetical protein